MDASIASSPHILEERAVLLVQLCQIVNRHTTLALLWEKEMEGERKMEGGTEREMDGWSKKERGMEKEMEGEKERGRERKKERGVILSFAYTR